MSIRRVACSETDSASPTLNAFAKPRRVSRWRHWRIWALGHCPVDMISLICASSTGRSSVTSTRGQARSGWWASPKSDPFCLPQHIETYSSDLFAALAKERHLRSLPRDEFLDRLTHYYAEVNAIHPFREGNGRAQRAFFHQLGREAGWPIDWSDLHPERNVAASMASLRGDNGLLRALLDTVTAR
ncbi:Fic/DOC family protein [Streptosporangium canum]|uniref:Fic/DOC family protein n=1 Tax=Streptosporangium canum TaxID=324952 RepID=UPI00379CDE6A